MLTTNAHTSFSLKLLPLTFPALSSFMLNAMSIICCMEIYSQSKFVNYCQKPDKYCLQQSGAPVSITYDRVA